MVGFPFDSCLAERNRPSAVSLPWPGLTASWRRTLPCLLSTRQGENDTSAGDESCHIPNCSRLPLRDGYGNTAACHNRLAACDFWVTFRNEKVRPLADCDVKYAVLKNKIAFAFGLKIASECMVLHNFKLRKAKREFCSDAVLG